MIVPFMAKHAENYVSSSSDSVGYWDTAAKFLFAPLLLVIDDTDFCIGVRKWRTLAETLYAQFAIAAKDPNLIIDRVMEGKFGDLSSSQGYHSFNLLI